jgi:hypothetical protein
MNVQHLSKSSLWMTPEPILEASRELMGGITLDPASDQEANERVKADFFISSDSLTEDWYWGGEPTQAAFLNPPGGRGQPKAFWNKLLSSWKEEYVGQAIYIAFSLEQLQQNQSMLDFPVCLPNKRLKYVSRWDPRLRTEEEFRAELFLSCGSSWHERGKKELLKMAKEIERIHGSEDATVVLIRERYASSPSHASAIVYLPPRAGDSEHRFVSKLAVQRFEDIFSKFGKVKL